MRITIGRLDDLLNISTAFSHSARLQPLVSLVWSSGTVVGQWLSQVRCRVWSPAPQVVLQADHVLHSENSGWPRKNLRTSLGHYFPILTFTVVTILSFVNLILWNWMGTIVIAGSLSCLFTRATSFAASWPCTPFWEFWRTWDYLK